MRSPGINLLSRLLIAAGALLLVFWAVAQLHSRFASTTAVAKMREAHVAPATPRAIAARPASVRTLPSFDPAKVDMTLWSDKRIHEFKEALQIKSEPAIAVLSIRRLGIEAPIFRGTDDLTLNAGLGWIVETPAPGRKGNSGIAGHRDSFFRPLKDVRLGDEIELETPSGRTTFVVSELSIVDPSDVGVLAPTQEPVLTLVTCYPFYFAGSAPERFIVRAVARGE